MQRTLNINSRTASSSTCLGAIPLQVPMFLGAGDYTSAMNVLAQNPTVLNLRQYCSSDLTVTLISNVVM